ncbi:MAG: AMP-binding protein [Myxococcales bacterium]|nr:AMP-binding protein [Myxococcales bacterium]
MELGLRVGPGSVIVDASGAHRYEDVAERSQRIAGALGARAVQPADRVALLLLPTAEFVSAFFALLRLGACVVVLSPLHPPPEMRAMLDDAGVGLVLTESALLAHLGEAAIGRRVVRLEDLSSGASGEGPLAPSARKDALQLYTSGTTGRPKGAILTHENLATQQRLLRDAWAFSEADVLLHALPLHHMHGLVIALMTALGSGASVRMLPRFDARVVWDSFAQVSVFMGVPAMYTRLVEAFHAADGATQTRWREGARGLRLATSGSAALPVPVADAWEAIAGSIPLERFGMTEIGVGLTNPLAPEERRRGFCGVPLPTVEARVVDDAGVDSDTGELWIRGPSVFGGYFGREEENRKAFVADPLGGAPWFRTGDTVLRDTAAGGAFRVLGRTSVDILKSGGYKLSALEIEGIILELGAVAAVAVVGVPDPRWGERVVACIVPAEGRESECDANTVREHVKHKLAPYKCPKDVILLAELPRNALGKVVKPELIRRLARLAP